MHSDDLFPQTKTSPASAQWEALEKRINNILEGIVQLRHANAQIMKENVHLKNQLKEGGAEDSGSKVELEKLRKQYDEALKDLKEVKENLRRIESLAGELNLEGHS